MGKVEAWFGSETAIRIGRLIAAYAAAAAALFLSGETEPQILSLLVFALMFLLLGLNKERADGRTRVVSAVLAAIYALCAVCANYAWLSKEYGFFSAYTVRTAALLWIFFYALLITLYPRMRAARMRRSGAAAWTSGRVFLVALIGLLLVYTWCFLCHFPGNVMADTRTQLAQIVGLDPYSNHHPMAHTLAMKAFFDLGYAIFGTQNAGVAFITVSQYVSAAAVFAFLLSTMHRACVRRSVLVCSFLFLAFAPNNLLFSITLTKDVPFALMGVLLFTLLWRRMGDPPAKRAARITETVLLAVGAAGVCALRTNGVYAFLVLLPLGLLLLPKKKWRALYPALLVGLAAALLFRGPALNAMGATPPDAIESLSIPAQHIARAVTDGCELTDDEAALLGEIVDVEKIAATYDPHTSDPIKELVRDKGNQAYLSSHSGAYLKLWLSLGARNPKEYLFAQIDETVGFWYPNVEYTSLYLGGIHNESTRLDISTEPVLTGEPAALLNAWLTGARIVPLLGLVYTIGTASWLGLLLLGLAILRKRTWQILPSLYWLLLFGTLMIATPVHAEFRYLYALFCMLPLLAAMPFAGPDGALEQ